MFLDLNPFPPTGVHLPPLPTVGLRRNLFHSLSFSNFYKYIYTDVCFSYSSINPIPQKWRQGVVHMPRGPLNLRARVRLSQREHIFFIYIYFSDSSTNSPAHIISLSFTHAHTHLCFEEIMGGIEAERTVTGWAAKDPSGILSPYSYTLR